jgi:GrpB-like predicted nucleotidyltransferase (UPF0157 family)
VAEQSHDPVDPPGLTVEGVHLSAYDPHWPDLVAGYADELRLVLDHWLLSPIEHVGSTAIPGIVAKPIIDLMAQVADADAVVAEAVATLSG